ncbi:TPA: hypothetical protein JBF07_04625 [Legionella pneumophila]|nr:hypothetical protein [Legionella pneumophila]
MKKLIILLLFCLSGCYESNHTVKETPRFRVYNTENIFTTLLLDTRTGRLWQTQYSLDDKHFEGTTPISTESYADSSAPNGRFALTKTHNMWTYILADTKTGALWHCQFSIKDDESRFCIPLSSSKENSL